MIICRTASRKGGSIISKEVFLGMNSEPSYCSYLALILTASLSSLRHGHNRQTSVSFRVHGPDRKDDIILRKVQSGAQIVAKLLDVFPFRAGGGSPQNLVLRCPSAGRRFPGESRIILQILRQQVHIRRRRRSRCQRRERRSIQTRHMRHIVEVYKLRQVAIFSAVLDADVLMLVMKVLAKL